MERITASVTKRHIWELKAQVRLGNASSQSAAVRHIIDEYESLRAEYAELQQEYEDLHHEHEQRMQTLESREDRIEQLEEQLTRRSQIESEIEDVAETVDDLPAKIRGVETYSERRQRKLDQASLAQRLKWKVTGVPVDDGEET
jgi:predicted RNase H-like nuclease (RuvC/YqgF family)